ncbi:MAG: hypothetical protein RIG77_19600 [Cyclobacteriaceae bacterium]
MRISAKPCRLRLLLWFFPIIVGLMLIGIIQDGAYEIIIVVCIVVVFGVVFYFVLPNVVEVFVSDQTINIRKGSVVITEPITNIEELVETFSFVNQNFSTWAFYRLALKQPNKLGNRFFFIARKSSLDYKRVIGDLRYKINQNINSKNSEFK